MAIINLYEQRKWILDRTLIAFWMASLLILVFSFHQQYIEKIEPCKLCKWQRYVFFLIFLFSPIGLIQHFNKSIRNILSIVFLTGCCLAIYHISVQFGWITDRCTMTQKVENMHDFMKMLEKPNISCASISWKLFGFSVSIYNAIFSFCALMVLNFKTIKRFIHVRRI